MAEAIRQREHMNVVIVGHVDHGKSTLIGRLLADTGTLPEGKLNSVKENCKRNAKPFEYAFLLDALKDEQSQGITIDTARSFFKSNTRDYIIIDAPGHIEFLKNMITGAARADAAVLVIDAHEGIRENSKRHGYMMSLLGIKNVTVCVNKMDLVQYSQLVFEKIKNEFTSFLKEINLKPDSFIPISAREGENIVRASADMSWYQGSCVLEALDQFTKAKPNYERVLRFPVQDIYKFTAQGDNRRIIAGRVESGMIQTGDEVVFLPSNKESRVASVEGFNIPYDSSAIAGESIGVCLDTQVYVRSGEVMCRKNEQKPHVSFKFKANVFWMAKQPFVKDKKYKLKLATQQVPAILTKIINVLDASELSSVANKSQVDRHDVAECIIETLKPVAFDQIGQIPETGRFVIVDNYEIAAGGIILSPVFEEASVLKKHIQTREYNWDRSHITPDTRAVKYKHKSILVVITGQSDTGKVKIAKALEESLFKMGKIAYFLGIANRLLSAKDSTNDKVLERIAHIQQLGEMAHVLTDAGLILITSISNVDPFELDMLKSLNSPNKTFIVNVGENTFSNEAVDMILASNIDPAKGAVSIIELLSKLILPDPEYSI